MRLKGIVLSLVLVLIILGSFNSVVLAESAKTNNEKEITIIEKTVCFNVSITDIYNSTITKTICVVVDFYIMNAEPGNASIIVDFPLTIHVGNKTISQVVKVPLKVKGEVTKIIVKGVKEGSEGENIENVIWVVPKETTTTPKPTASPTKSTTPPKTTTTKPPTHTPTKTITKTVTKTVTPKENRNEVDLSYILYLLLVLVGVLGGYIIYKGMRKERKKEEKREERESIEDYIETLKLLKEKLEEKEQELEKERKTPIKFRIKCPFCGNNVSPVIMDDGRIICPVCRNEIGRIREDGSLELIPLEKRGENGVLRESRAGDAKKETGKIQGGAREEAGEGEQED